jgi:hypothetical protein
MTIPNGSAKGIAPVTLFQRQDIPKSSTVTQNGDYLTVSVKRPNSCYHTLYDLGSKFIAVFRLTQCKGLISNRRFNGLLRGA